MITLQLTLYDLVTIALTVVLGFKLVSGDGIYYIRKMWKELNTDPKTQERYSNLRSSVNFACYVSVLTLILFFTLKLMLNAKDTEFSLFTYCTTYCITGLIVCVIAALILVPLYDYFHESNYEKDCRRDSRFFTEYMHQLIEKGKDKNEVIEEMFHHFRKSPVFNEIMKHQISKLYDIATQETTDRNENSESSSVHNS